MPAGCPSECPKIKTSPSGHAAEHRFVHANGIRFHTVQMGEGPLVLLLHGFPEFWYSWRHQLPALADSFRVVAPDLRGYNLTDRPARGYDLRALVADVSGLIGALGYERAHVVGHDWGGVVAWHVGMWAPERLDKLAVLDAAHPAAYYRELRRNNNQRSRSTYVLYFLIPGLAETMMSWGGCRAVGKMLKSTAVVPGAFSESDLAEYRKAACRPGALAAGLAYYRELGRVGLRRFFNSPTIQAETLFVWGMQDAAGVPELADGLEAWVPNLRVVRVPDSGHWVQQERPELVTAELLSFLD